MWMINKRGAANMVQIAHAGRRTILRTVLTGAALTIAVGGLLVWLAGVFQPKVPATTPARAELEPVGSRTLVPVRAIRVPAVESAVGTIRAVQEATLSAEVMAKVVAVNVSAGQRVKRGDLLVRLDDEELSAQARQAEAAVAAARAARDQARTEFERVKALAAQNVASTIEYQRAETALKSAEAEVQRAEQVQVAAAKNLSYAQIVSPFDGSVVDKRVNVGDIAMPQKVLLTLYDPTRMQLVASVRESLIDRIKLHQNLAVQIGALGRTCAGSVSEIVPESDVASRSFLVKVTGPCDPEIHSGMFGRLLIPVDEEQWVVVPRNAVRRVGQLEMVAVADPEGRALERRVVQLGRVRGEDVEVLSGVRVGERVALPVSESASGQAAR
jgi:RND family efflux transporter MFP subunit